MKISLVAQPDFDSMATCKSGQSSCSVGKGLMNAMAITPFAHHLFGRWSICFLVFAPKNWRNI